MNRGVIRRIAGILCALLLLLTMSGCSRQVPKEKTVIKILYNEDFKKIEELVESTYDDIDIQTELSLYPSEQLRRLNRGVGPDLVITAQPDTNLVKKYLLDISDTRASASYDGTIMNAWKTDLFSLLKGGIRCN